MEMLSDCFCCCQWLFGEILEQKLQGKRVGEFGEQSNGGNLSGGCAVW